MLTINISQKFILLVLAASPAFASANTLGPFHIIESKPVDEVWLNPGFYSYHFQKDKGLNSNNLGFGAEYRYSNIGAITAGRFHNSDSQISSYLALYWQPLELGGIRFGALLGVINGYPQARNGDWFPMILPGASYEYKNLGIGLTIVPAYKDYVQGSLSLQFKLKVY